MELLSNIFQGLCCPECQQQNMSLSENTTKKKGLSSMLVLNCACGYLNEFYTSRNSGKGFDVNRRTVYAMRALGHGYTGVEKYMTLMNMPKPFTVNTYNKIVVKMATVAKEIALPSMNEAVKEIREKKGATDDEVIDIGVSADGSWQRRGFSSNNGVVTAISIETGKVVDIEAMSKICKACCLKESMKENDPVAYANWRNSHMCLQLHWFCSWYGIRSETNFRSFRTKS